MTNASSPEYLRQFVEETDWYNEIVLGPIIPGDAWKRLPRPIQSWLRNYIGGTAVYFITGLLWCFYIYYWKRNVYLPKDAIPSNKAMFLQIIVTMKAMPLYSGLPTISEYMVESGWTRCYSSIGEVGWLAHAVYLMIYLVLVEFGIYWMHRVLHDIKPLYKWLHAKHHIYNKQNTLSPFAVAPRAYRGRWAHDIFSIMARDRISQELTTRHSPHYAPPTYVSPLTSLHTRSVCLGGSLRIGIPSVGWHTAGCVTCDCSLPCPNPLLESHGSTLLRGCMDCQCSRLHTWQDLANHGRRLPYNPPYHIPSQLRPLHNMDGLDVWHPSRS